ncbi:hypothetical protein HZI73_23680 [Vallitalea pronyensis]|uniref:Uncharacterized protein n=1 Tax=Vallitalea pronyensis TaxID=1348613 RepID=A0A8J8MND6_9FIRM|nr:hypothetical protein [Vallitalea pronyensis]QUI25112.1 hypothetical protein HZI73_23680 [Vallitalea pronyensis]
MIYIASLAAFGKKTFGDKIFQTKTSKIIEQLVLNPKVSGMDSVILGPKDLANATTRSHLAKALDDKHPDVLVIYLYTNDKEAELLNNKQVTAKKIEKRINLQSFKETATEIYEHMALTKKGDIQKPKVKTTCNDTLEEVSSVESVPLETLEAKPSEPLVEEPTQVSEEPVERENSQPQRPVTEYIQPEQSSPSKMTEERIKACIQFSDWDLFKRLMTKDTIVSDLMLQNNDYAMTINMLSKLDQDIVAIFKDDQKTVEERFSAIKEIGIKRSNYRVKQNSIISEKIASILTTITVSAETMIHQRLHDITSALNQYDASDKRLYRQNKETLEALIDQRMTLQFELHELSKNLITIYQSMDATVNQIIGSFDSSLPSDNTYVNEIYKTSAQIFTPINAPKLAAKLMSDLQKNRISLSALENLIQEVVSKVFYLCEMDESIITHQSKLIKLLESQNVEDVVIVDTILKNTLRLYIGPSDVGTRATTITWAGILSRRQNTLLIDLSGHAKFKDYGIGSITLEHFLEHAIQEHFVCVEGHLLRASELEPIIIQLKKRLHYYPYINIILDTSQADLIKELANHALSITYISDCTNRSNALVKQSHEHITLHNIAKKIVLIDPTIDEMLILRDLSMDPLITKLIMLPYLSKIKSCVIKAQPPYLDPEIRTIFEEAFR